MHFVAACIPAAGQTNDCTRRVETNGVAQPLTISTVFLSVAKQNYSPWSSDPWFFITRRSSRSGEGRCTGSGLHCGAVL